MNRKPFDLKNLILPCLIRTGSPVLTTCFAALSASFQNLVIRGLACRHASMIPGSSFSGISPFVSIAFMAPTPPPYPSANSATLPFCRRCPLTPCFSTGTWNMLDAEAQ